MKKKSVRKGAFAIAAATLLLTGCQSNVDNSAETEALKEQIAQLEQQIATLEQQAANDNAANNNASNDNAVNDNASNNNATNDNASNDNASNDATASEIMSVPETIPQQTDTSVGDSRQPDMIAGDNTQILPDVNAGGSHVPGHDEERYHNPAHDPGNGSVSNQQGVSAAGLTTYTMEDLSSMVDAFVQKASAAAPSGTSAQNMEQFLALKQEEKQIDDLLDQHEDELEYLYKAKTLTREAYKQLERELELLEDKLDAAEDQLEYTFGIDD